ncbi:MAG: protein-disulfide isomerase [Microbacterium sp.]|uniref:Protein-disulfide isomerase n=1 Tax=Microbacterium ginsengisoli TaxID=400772 RepID=A0A3C1KA09_9MICO|nr:thioredoxin domain-containing protein [uncultured Microbacterium sp.]MAL06194.1 protein-disulfide isomerase [Microbacterium sp.]HAN23224.1 protein-disulfide isomerase [Microbacterium ginsengisoli]
MSSNDSSDAAVPADSSVDRRSAVREKAQLVHARQSRARRWRIALLSALAVVVVAAIGAGIAIALVTPSGKPQLTPPNATDSGFRVSDVSARAAIASTASPSPSTDAAAAAASPSPSSSSASNVDIRIYIDYLAPGSKEFQLANAQQLSTWVSQGAATLTYYPVAMLAAKSNGTKYSLRAASAAVCVATQQPDSLFSFTQSLLSQQPSVDSDGLSDQQLASVAVGAGSDDTVSDCIENEKYMAWVKDATDAALKSLPATDGLKLTAAPTILVNGKPYTGALDDPKEFAQFVLTSASEKYYSTPTPTPSSSSTPLD